MNQAGIEVDDLHASVLPALGTLQQPHDVCFTAEGYRVLGSEAAEQISHYLPSVPL
jgi:hypothetical protein